VSWEKYLLIIFSADFEEEKEGNEVERVVRAAERYVPMTADVQSMDLGHIPAHTAKYSSWRMSRAWRRSGRT